VASARWNSSIAAKIGSGAAGMAGVGITAAEAMPARTARRDRIGVVEISAFDLVHLMFAG
jgi:hypothetical protein